MKSTESNKVEQILIDKAIIGSQARKIYHRNVLIKSISIILTIIFLLLLVSFGVGSLINTKGGLSVIINQKEGKIALSETRDLKNTTTHLNAEGLYNCDNITYEWLKEDLDEICNTDGSHNGENYFAHTFYLVNTGDIKVDVLSEMKVVTNYMNAVEATRIMVIKDDETNIYAKPRTSDGEPEHVPEQVQNFASESIVFSDKIVGFEPKSLIKYTIVIWLEGYDPECVDDILGGAIKFTINFSVIDDQN